MSDCRFGVSPVNYPDPDPVKNAENDIFSLASSNLMSIFSPNIGHREKIISKS